jgi:hypothetical protein
MVAHDPITAEVQRQELVRFCLGLHQKLARWFANHLALIQKASQVTPLWDINLPTPFHNPTDIALLHVMTLYWATSTFVDSILRVILRNGEPRPSNLNPEASCGKIIVGLSNLLHPDIGLYRIHLVTVPLGIVMTQLQDPSIQLDLLREERRLLVHCLSHPGCSSISKFLNKLTDALHFNMEIC